MLQRLGRFLFRWRGTVFPLVVLTLVMAFPPRLARSPLDNIEIILGILVLLAGQTLRALTIGWDYIERGGHQGRVSASRLVVGGMYALCRNPMYVGNILLVAGFLILYARPAPALVGMGFCLFIYRAIVAAEEAFLASRFGDDFAEYCKHVPRWLPSLRMLRREMGQRSADTKVILLREYSTLSVTAAGAIVLTMWRLHGAIWDISEFVIVSVLTGIILGFYLTMRFLKVRRIIYVPR